MSKSDNLTDLKTLLKQRGFSDISAQIWAEFAQHVLELYWRAADQLIEPTNWAFFMQKAGAMGKPKRGRVDFTVRAPMEDAITSEIGYRADELFKELPSDHFLRRHSVKLDYEKLVPSENRAGRHSKKIDFYAVSQYFDAPEIAIEAKPIKAHADINSQYLGAAGLGCFLTSDSPYTKGPLAALLAYTINSDGCRMQEQIRTALQAYQPAPTQIRRTSFRCTGTVDFSNHDRVQWNMKPVSILHLERVFPLDMQQFK